MFREPFALSVLLAVAGCLTTGSSGANSYLSIDYCTPDASAGDRKVDDYELSFDGDRRASHARYEAVDATPASYYTMHDQLEQFSAENGVAIETKWFAEYSQFLLERIDGVGGSPKYWLSTINGEEAQGMSVQEVRQGDRVAWTLSPCP